MAEKELERCKKLGIEPPKLFPHPDQIILDLRNETWWVEGPLSEKEQKESLAAYEEQREGSREMIQFLQDRLAKSEKRLLEETDPKARRRLARDIQRDSDLIGTLKQRAEELIKVLTPWGFTETRPLWDDLVSDGGDSNESEARPEGERG